MMAMKMICCKEIDDYLEYYHKAPNVFNNERKLLIENIVIPTLSRDDIFFDESTYRKCIKFVERWYYPLFPYQKFLYAFVFMYKDDVPVFRTFIILEGRGNGKDGFIVPLLHFLTTQYYGVENYNIDIVATSEGQANDTFDVAYSVLDKNENIMKKYFYWNKEYFVNKITRSRFRFNTSNAATKDGKKSGLVLFNEYHAYLTDKNIKVYQGGLGKVKHGRIFIITSNGDVRGGPLDELLDSCTKILQTGDNKLRYFPFLCKMDDLTEVDNPELWEKANPSLPYLPELYDAIMIDYLEQKERPSKRSEFLSKRMNIPQERDDLVVTSWENILKASYSDVKNKVPRLIVRKEKQPAIIGIDFASLRDFASVGILTKDGNEFCWRQKTVICSSNKFFKDIKFPFENAGQKGFEDFVIVDTPSIDEKIIVNWALSYFNDYDIKKIILDNYRYQLIKKTFEESNVSVETKENKDGLIRMIRYPASIAAIVAPKLEVLFERGQLNIGDSAIMRWSINNTCLRTKKDGNMYFEKVEEKLRKNDPFMAMICALSGEELLVENIEYVYV
ncbi:phage terminase-like protein large subunit [Mycoplasma sp. CAG:877]|nr:phage terminase-like protein large subunit [Mycoplasma sp. CAG:877]